MQLLLTNDDGIDAPGLSALHDSLSDFLQRRAITDCELVVVAPDRGRSECGHSVTTNRDLHVEHVRPNWYHVDGTPVDCVRVALHLICPDVMAVFSGINAGANVGVDLMVSGTFAAAREASVLGRPAMAVSHYRRPDVAKTWDHCSQWLAKIFELFWGEASLTPISAQPKMPNGSSPLWNVNLPAVEPSAGVPSIIHCPVELQPMQREGVLEAVPHDATRQRVRMQSEFHGRPRQPGTDVDQCFGGKISVSELAPIVG